MLGVVKLLYEDKLYEGLSVEFFIDEGEYKGKYRTKIEELGEKIISIGVPIKEGHFVPLREGTPLRVFFCDDLTAYIFASVIIQRLAAPIPTLIIEYPQRIIKIQRRKYVRVEVVNFIQYRIVEKDGLGDYQNGYMLDLSGGGMLIGAEQRVKEKSLILIDFPLKEERLELPGKVIRCLKDDEKKQYQLSVEFHNIVEKTRDKIIRYVFDIQREMRQKGLI